MLPRVINGDVMKHLVFSICAANYLNKADVLFDSVRLHMPEAVTALVILEHEDTQDVGALSEIADIVIFASSLEIERFDNFIFRFDVLEASTVIKPKSFLYLFKSCPHVDIISFLDPDMQVHADLRPAIEAALEDDGAFLLTPHHLHDEPTYQGAYINMRRSLVYGAYNLGFTAFNRGDEALAALRWWHDKLKDFCFNDPNAGFFLDQKWMDLAVGLFSGARILRHSGFNVANWNVAKRGLNRQNGLIACGDDAPLSLMHFSSVDDGKDLWHINQAGERADLYLELREAYLREIQASRWVCDAWCEWSYARYASGQPISKLARKAFRDKASRCQDPDPFSRSNSWFVSA